LEVVVLPVSDIAAAKRFYAEKLGWRLDGDAADANGLRIVQVTPPGSPCSIIFGRPPRPDEQVATPGSTNGLVLAVHDIDAARSELVQRGVEVSEVFNGVRGLFHNAGTTSESPGPDPERRSYFSFASFSDPDGNGWLLQEVPTRLPGR